VSTTGGKQPASYWCELAWLGGDAVDADVLVEIAGDRITAVDAAVTAPPADAIRLEGLTIPGLANAHSHAFHRALRGRTQGESGSFWTWRERMYAVAERLDPDRYRALARAAFAEMVLAGFTAVGEFHYVHHAPGGEAYAAPNEIADCLVEAARAAGLRITLLDTCYLRAGFDEAEPHPVQRRFIDPGVAAWAARVEGLAGTLAGAPDARVGAAIHSVRAVDGDSARDVASWARERALPLHAHVSEQRAENEACLAATGVTPAGLLAEAGVLDERFTAVHATHLADEDLRLLGAAGATCCLCPTTERDLADGVGPAARLIDAGATLAVGTDSHAVVDAFEEARAIELDERLATGERGRHRPADLLRAATAGGHSSIGWPEAGQIEPGAIADLVTVDLDGVRLAGTAPEHAVAAVVFAATAADVRTVIAGGRQIVRDGAHVALDVGAELEAAIEAVLA
jgi:formiminoglutamate deiminase